MRQFSTTTSSLRRQQWLLSVMHWVPTSVTAPLDLSRAAQNSLAVTGTTNGQIVVVGVGGAVYTAIPQNGAFNIAVPLALEGNVITPLPPLTIPAPSILPASPTNAV